MRVLFTTIPSSGHFHPLAPLALAARAAGHQVAFACAESLRPAVGALGAEMFAAGLDRDGGGDPEFDALKRRARALPPGGAEIDRLGVVDVLYGVRARRMLPGVVAACARWKPDVVVRESFEAAGAVAGDLLGIPHACVLNTPLYDLRAMEDGIRGELDRVRAQAGLGPDPAMPHRYLTLCFAPPSLLDPALPRPATLHAFRPGFFDRSGGEELPEWMDRLPARPTVYVTLGTVAGTWRPDALELLARALAGLGGEPLNVVATVGRDADPAALGPQPDNVRVERYVPQSLLLPRCHACVSHAGFNTVMGALDAGLPQVLVPLLADDPCNARRCAALGLGVALAPAQVAPERVRRAVRAVLAGRGYRARVRRMRAELHALPGVEEAVALLERLAVERTPLSAGRAAAAV